MNNQLNKDINKKKKNVRRVVVKKSTKNNNNNKYVTVPQVKQIVKQHETALTPNQYGARFMEALVNPFGNALKNGPRDICALIPDGRSRRLGVLLKNSFRFAGETASDFYVVLQPPCKTYADATHSSACRVYYGGSVNGSGSSPDNFYAGGDPTTAALYNALGATKSRVISMALKVNYCGPEDKRGGLIHSGWLTQPMQTSAVPAYSTYADALSHKHSEEDRDFAPADAGITVRRAFSKDDETFTEMPDYIFDQFTGEGLWVRVRGLDDTAGMVNIEWVIHFEIDLATPVPFHVSDPALAYDSEMAQIVHTANASEYVVSGHSFKSFIRRAVKIGKQAYSLYNKFQQPLRDVASTLLPLLI